MKNTLNLRDLAVEVIKGLPATSSMEEIMYQVGLVGKVMEGMEDAKNGRVTSTEDLLKEMKTWGK